MNLATDPWVPVRRKSGALERIAPHQVTQAYDRDPIVAVDATRTPWNGAGTEFLIALFQTALAPLDARVWRSHWDAPPDAEYLKREIGKVAHHFSIDRFMQDPSVKAADYETDVRKLFLDGLSDNQIRNNAQFRVREAQYAPICMACSALALYDLQAHAAQDSGGYFTSLRGGGPITTLIRASTLWRTIWANVLELPALGISGSPDPSAFLPWVSPLGKNPNPSEVSPLHVFWGMPRRVSLNIQNSTTLTCATCAEPTDHYVPSIFTYRGGHQYKETEWRHPLAPYVAVEGGFAVRGTQTDLEGYRNWMGILVDTPGAEGLAALVVRRWLERDIQDEPEIDVWAYGYLTDKATVQAWCEGRMPISLLQGVDRKLYERVIRTVVALSTRAAERVSEVVLMAFKGIGFKDFPAVQAKTAGRELWSSTQSEATAFMREAFLKPEFDAQKLTETWSRLVWKRAIKIGTSFLSDGRVDRQKAAFLAHRLSRQLSDHNPMVLKTRHFGDWRIRE